MVLWPPGAREFAAAARVARLATAGADGAPHAVPICFALVGDRLYSVVDAKPKRNPTGLKRLRNIEENPHAAVVIDHYEDDWSRLRYVMLRGPAAVVGDRVEFDEAVSALRAKYSAYRSMVLEFERNPLLCVFVERVNHWSFE